MQRQLGRFGPLLICAPVWKSFCPVHIVVFTAFVTEAYLCGFISVPWSQTYAFLQESVTKMFFTQKKSGTISVSLPISSCICFPNFLFVSELHNKEKEHLVTGLLWLLLSHLMLCAFLGTGATVPPFPGCPCSHSGRAPRRKVVGPSPGKRGRRAAGALLWTGHDPKWPRQMVSQKEWRCCGMQSWRHVGWQRNFSYL